MFRPKSATYQVLLGALLISFSPVFVKLAHVGPTAAGVYRTAIGAVALFIFALLSRQKIYVGLRPFVRSIAIGFIFACDLTAWHHSINFIGPGLSTILGNFQVFILVAYGIVILKEKLTARFIAAVPLAVIGLIMIFGWRWNDLALSYKLGILLGLGTAFSYACFTLTLRYSQARPDAPQPAANLAIISIATAFFMAIIALIKSEAFIIADTQTLFSLFGYGLLCQALAWGLISRSLPHIPASLAGLALLLQPTLAFVWDIVLFGRPLHIIELAGVALALTAIYLGSGNRR